MIYVWVRASPEWYDTHAFLAQVRPAFKVSVDLWNDTFTMPFHVFRGRVRDIARLNLSRAEGVACAPWDEIPDGALVLPVDDDDWFAPDVAVVLADVAPNSTAAVFRWPAAHVEVAINRGHAFQLLRRRVLPWAGPRWTCTTNNYAMYKRPDTEVLLKRHTEASAWVDANPDRVRQLDHRLSAMNRTLASQTSLGHLGTPISRRALVRKHQQYRRLYERALPADLSWAQPYVEMMGKLMTELDVVSPT